ncbi:MAG: DEAD/DEAH box helicase, partial [Clostridiaceae bacterium]|nr:DEAD/DEAH box helicase [Clostridiaceae bacterium]
MPINPIKASEAIKSNYISYLSTVFHVNDMELQEQFINLLEQDNKFVKGPILEATPSFQLGNSLQELIDENVLSNLFSKLDKDSFDINRRLYRHQEKAIRKVISENRNIVVATGTGSGKTETFLIPILNHLLMEKENGLLGPGVRALLLYPMNALANDQMSR